MNFQSTFDTIVTALIKQGVPSRNMTPGGACMYRGPNGIKCAVGHLLPDHLVVEHENKVSIFRLNSVSKDYLTKTLMGAISHVQQDLAIEFLATMQGAHDKEFDVDRGWLACFKDEARVVANRYTLDTSVLDEVVA